MIFKQARLENGLEVVAELNETARSTAAGFFVKTGSRDESAELAGVSHFLEHMVFKGTPTRDAIQVNRDFDKVGAKHNAQTSEEDTVYHAACLPEYLPATLDVLADLLRPTIRPEDFETEKKVIIEEIRMYLDNPMMVAYEAAKHEHHAPHPLGQSVLGTVESIEALTVEQMKGYFERRYGPSNIVLAFAGNANWDELVALAERVAALGKDRRRNGSPRRSRVTRAFAPSNGRTTRSKHSSLPRTRPRSKATIGTRRVSCPQFSAITPDRGFIGS